MLNVYIDGACEPTLNNLSSYGLIVRRDVNPPIFNNMFLLKEGKIIGSGSAMSNNVAEYSALITFFLWYRSCIKNNEDVLIHSDSQFRPSNHF